MPQPPQARKIAKAQKPSPIVDSEAAETIVVLFPPIKETEYRGQHRTSYSFIGPDDSSVFAFDSFKQARKEREKMRPLYLQAAVFDGVVRVKSKGGRPALSEDE